MLLHDTSSPDKNRIVASSHNYPPQQPPNPTRMKKDITNSLTQAVAFWVTVEAEVQQLAASYNVSIPSSLAVSQECLTRPSDAIKIDTEICAILILDDDSVAGKVVIEGISGADDIINIGNNDKRYWIMLVKPEQKCQVFGRCKFWLYSWKRNIPSEAGSSSGYISAWSDWAWDTRYNKWGRYRLSGSEYEYEWRDPEPSTSS